MSRWRKPEIDLESTRFGRIVQVMGVVFILLGLGMTALDIAVGSWPAAPINLVTIGAGAWCLLRVGPDAIRTARQHKAFMDDHRVAEQRLRQSGRWN